MSLRKSPHEAASALETGDIAPREPMTAAQAAELKRLAGEGREPEAFAPSLTKAEAAERIKALKAKLRLMSEPPHTA